MGRGCLHTVKAENLEGSGGQKGGASWRMPKPLLSQQPQRSRERKRPTVPLGGLCPHTGCAAGGAKELPDRLWIT